MEGNGWIHIPRMQSDIGGNLSIICLANSEFWLNPVFSVLFGLIFSFQQVMGKEKIWKYLAKMGREGP